MKNPIYLTHSELITWHEANFGEVPSDIDGSLHDHCHELYLIVIS